MGFGAAGHSIFRALDNDRSGAVSYHELQRSLTVGVNRLSGEAKSLISAMVMSLSEDNEEEEAEHLVDTSEWEITGFSVEEVRRNLQEKLQSSGAHVADILRLFDQDKGSKEQLIDDVEFYTAMRTRLGFVGPTYVLKSVFKSIDTDGDGAVGFDELFEFVRGQRHSFDKRNKQLDTMRLEMPAGSNLTLEEIAWDADTLTLLLQQMLEKNGVGSADLMRMWDSGGNGELSMREFVAGIGSLIDSDKLREREVEPAAREAFEDIDLCVRHEGRASLLRGQVDIVELERWIAQPITRNNVIQKKTPGASRAKRISRDRRIEDLEDMRVATPAGAGYELEDLDWDTQTLRFLMQKMLEKNNLRSVDLIKAWDTSGNGQLSRFEIREKLSRFFPTTSLWNLVDPVVRVAFAEIDEIRSPNDDPDQIDMFELQDWLNKPCPRFEGDAGKSLTLSSPRDRRRPPRSRSSTGTTTPRGTPRGTPMNNPRGAQIRQEARAAVARPMAGAVGVRRLPATHPYVDMHRLPRWEVPDTLPPLPPLPSVCSPRAYTPRSNLYASAWASLPIWFLHP